MAIIKVVTPDGEKSFEAENGIRLVNAIEDAGIDIGHRCGGYAGCTTCRVKVIEGEPVKITKAEKAKLSEFGLQNQFRLSCQIIVEQDMKIEPAFFVSKQDWDGKAGNRPKDSITPDPVWIEL
ncbi:MAG: 2Fe-2S iron-sulfur cluster-binding protein [Candidatus Hodarchaeales archaeon]|jgi:ferredoxin